MIRRSTLSILIVLLVAVSAFAAPTTVRGRVLAADGTPYPSAAVTLKSRTGARTAPVYTDREGMFYVANVAPGAYTMVVRTSRSETPFSVSAQPRAYSDVPPVRVR
jgi:carboxypeptidase family protein